ncbi:MAG: IS91 family transposase [Salinisphaeraceae bacterium]|nr:IS91 family transposase [Salinisphaeraceae bacterium]
MRTTVSELIRQEFPAYAARRKLRIEEHKAAQAMMACRTSVMGSFEYSCPEGHESWQGHHSCHHRSCPQCNGQAKAAWLDKTLDRLLPCDHFHVVMTLPHELNDLWRHNRVWFSQTLFACAADSLKQMLVDPRHLGAIPGLMLAEHTWGRSLIFHPHVHCLVTAGGVDAADQWRAIDSDFLLPGRALDIRKLALPGDCSVRDIRRLLFLLARKPRHVRIEKRYSHGRGVAGYLARYVKGGPIGNRRLTCTAQNKLRFRYFDHRSHQHRWLTLERQQFLARLLSHVPPAWRQRVRYYGLYHSHRRQLRSRLGEQMHAPQIARTRTRLFQPPRCRQCKRPYQSRHWRFHGNYLYQVSAPRRVRQGVEVGVPSRPNTLSGDTGPPHFSFLPSGTPLN